MKTDKRFFLLVFAIQTGLMTLAFVAGYFVHYFLYPGYREFPLFYEAISLLEKNALKDLPPANRLEYGMIRGVLQEFNDPYTVFVEPPQHEIQSNQLEGKFGGIGARLEQDQEKNLLLYPFPNSPAAQAGIVDGDRLLQIDDLRISPEISTDEIQAAIRGPVGTKVKLIISHSPYQDEITVEIKRAEFNLPSTTWNLAADAPNIGVIQINIIASTTPAEVEGAMKDLISRGAKYFILDVRNNYGGLVDAGVDTARLFLDSGIVINQQYRDQPVQSYTVESKGQFADLPLVIFINHNTASAAEIIAGSLQGQKRAVLIGTPTYGKDTIQLIFELKDGSSLHVTAAQWWVPQLSSKIAGVGLQPDILIPDDQANDAAYMEKAIQVLTGQ